MRPTSTKKAPLAPPPQLPLVEDTGPARTRWFGDGAAVVWEGRLRRVWVGGMKVEQADRISAVARGGSARKGRGFIIVMGWLCVGKLGA